MSHRGLSFSVAGPMLSLVLGFVLTGAQRAEAQALEKLSEFLQKNQNQSDELPPPAKGGQRAAPPTTEDSKTVPDAETPASERIYLGLEAEPAVEGIGVRVATVTRDSPAWKAGFKVEDRILGVNGFAIGNIDNMVEQLGKTRPGQSVNFLIQRDGKNRELVAVLMNAELADKIQNRPINPGNGPAWLGVTSSDLTNSFREQFGIAPFRGAAVTQVVTGSPAYQGGIRPGDVVVEAAGRPVDTAADLQRWVEQSKPGDQAQIVFFRGAGRQTAKIVLTSDPQLQPPTPQTAKPAFPAVKPLNNANPGTKVAKPLPVDPTLNPNANPPLVLEPQQPANERELALEAEIVELRKQLAEAQAKLAETKQQLDNILRALKD
jgi:predicted metalloprotease with PDZ domain